MSNQITVTQQYWEAIKRQPIGSIITIAIDKTCADRMKMSLWKRKNLDLDFRRNNPGVVLHFLEGEHSMDCWLTSAAGVMASNWSKLKEAGTLTLTHYNKQRLLNLLRAIYHDKKKEPAYAEAKIYKSWSCVHSEWSLTLNLV